MAFKTESEMVEAIKRNEQLHKLMMSGKTLMQEEMSGLFGIPDLIFVKKNSKKRISYAYEAKLSNWSRALTQAFRYKAFVNKSFVILDHDHINPALSNTDKFCKANVGLISIDDSGNVQCYYNPYYEAPYSPRLENKFNEKISSLKF